jgi:hypothetical protein
MQERTWTTLRYHILPASIAHCTVGQAESALLITFELISGYVTESDWWNTISRPP